MFTKRPIKIFGEAEISFTFSFAKALFIGVQETLIILQFF